MLDWFNNPIPEKKPDPETQGSSPNPCVNLYGPGPDDKKCGNCTHVFGICNSNTHYKCDLRKNTRGAKTDQKLRWPACGKFEQRENKAIPLYDGRS